MDGNDPDGRKVGLLDRHHLMCFLVDPFSWEWRHKFLLQANVKQIVREMVQKFVPLDKDGSSSARNRVTAEFKVRISIDFDIGV